MCSSGEGGGENLGFVLADEVAFLEGDLRFTAAGLGALLRWGVLERRARGYNAGDCSEGGEGMSAWTLAWRR